MGSPISELMGDPMVTLVRTYCVQLLGSNDFEKFDLEY